MAVDDHQVWRFDWGRMRGEVAALGGMLAPVWFELSPGRSVQPLAVAPWSDDPPEQLATLPPLLRQLRGEWPCVPFGVPFARDDLPPEWAVGAGPGRAAIDPFFHGYSSNHLWHLLAEDDQSLTIAIDYPDDHPVRRLTRRIARAGPLALSMTLTIEMRRAAVLPIGLHPVLAIPEPPHRAVLDLPNPRRAANFPVPVEPGSVLVPGQVRPSLQGFRTRDGGSLDLSRHPLPVQTEELVMVEPETGSLTLARPDEGFSTRLSWDERIFPHCLLWISNRGRSDYPWNGRHRALGVEPIASIFDLGEVHSRNPASPAHAIFSQAGARQIPATGLTTSYRIEVSALD